MTTLVYLVSAESRINITGLSCREAAEKLAGKLGKTSITELMSGKRQGANGWHIEKEEQRPIEMTFYPPAPLASGEHNRYSKTGVEYVGTGKRRPHRQPMEIRLTLTPQGVTGKQMCSGDYRKLLDTIAQRDGQEIGEIASRLGWSRQAVQSVAHRAVHSGMIVKTRKSGAFFGKKEN